MRKVAIPILIAVLMVGAAFWRWRIWQQAPYLKLSDEAWQIQRAVERFAVDSDDSSYPRDIGELLKHGYLQSWPQNPFGQGTLTPLKPEDHWLAGGFVYVPDGPTISRGTADSRWPPEIDRYFLAFYAPHGMRVYDYQRIAIGLNKEWREDDAQSKDRVIRPDREGEFKAIDWTHVAKVLTDGMPE